MSEVQENPYASPALVAPNEVPAVAELVDTEAERIRRELIGTEMSIRSIGQFSVILGILCTVIAIPLFAHREYIDFFVWWCVAAVLLGLGYGIVSLRNWARWPAAGVLSILTVLVLAASLASGIRVLLIVVPFCAYLVYLFAGKKGSRVMTPEYVAIRLQTPHVRYRPAFISWNPTAALIVFVSILAVGGILLFWR